MITFTIHFASKEYDQIFDKPTRQFPHSSDQAPSKLLTQAWKTRQIFQNLNLLILSLKKHILKIPSIQ